jgi:hypothetical protein
MTEVTRVCRFELDSRGFVRATMMAGAEFTLPDAVEALAATARCAGRVPVPVLVDMRAVKSQTREAREHFGSEAVAPICAAVALLVGTPVSRVLGNFFMRRSEQPVPARLFTEESKAIEWLSEQRR